jgi:hypothetical protein
MQVINNSRDRPFILISHLFDTTKSVQIGLNLLISYFYTHLKFFPEKVCQNIQPRPARYFISDGTGYRTIANRLGTELAHPAGYPKTIA